MDPHQTAPSQTEIGNGLEAGRDLAPSPSRPSYAVGDAVELAAPLRYLKTADPMPMLRPPDLVDPGEPGTVTEIRPLDLLAVRFRRGTFLIAATDLRPLDPGG